MWPFIRKSLGSWLALGLVQHASAFSMLGPYATDYGNLWQVPTIGYNQPGDIGGPMNLGQEYRWNVRNIYYGFSSTFLNYFGIRGRDEVEKAIKMINDLPAMSSINIDNYPLKTERVNHQASALGLLDLKTTALCTLVEALGLADPERYVFTLRVRYLPPNQTNYYVIKRNFDPVTLRPSSYINGDLWTYTTIVDNQELPIAYPVNRRVDPLAYGDPVASGYGFFGGFSVGGYYTGLTRDDVGGLRYIYHRENRNVEPAHPDAFSGGAAIVAPGAGGGTTDGSPWIPVYVVTTNIAVGGTNVVAAPAATNIFGNTVLRSGIDRLRLVRADYDSLLGQNLTPVLDAWSDEYVTNGVVRSQTLRRYVVAPDILFNGADATGDSSAAPAGPASIFRNASFQNQWQLNTSGGAQNAGPGTIGPAAAGQAAPTIVITFNTVGPMIVNGPWPYNLSEETGMVELNWGSFDGTTNAPVVYPNAVTLGDLERRVLGRR
jgi:hypothetical protein